MQSSYKYLIGFLILAAVQIFVPANMISQSEQILTEGIAFKFRTAPIDPTDPFRGKYVVLSFEQNTYDITEDEYDQWKAGTSVYVEIENDADGFASIANIHPQDPGIANVVRAKIDYVYQDKLFINYPFTRFYMDEFKAKPAEDLHREIQADSLQESYAVVFVDYGKAALADVQIDGVSIKDLVKPENEYE